MSASPSAALQMSSSRGWSRSWTRCARATHSLVTLQLLGFVIGAIAKAM